MPEHSSSSPLKETRIITDIPEIQEYRDLVSRAHTAARAYDGTQTSYEKMMRLFIQLEEKAASLRFTPKHSIQKQEQITADILSSVISPEQKTDISALLTIAAESAAHSVRRAIHAPLTPERLAVPEITPQSPLLVQHINGSILPPDPNQSGPIHGEGVFEPARFEERIIELTRLLETQEIFLNDYIVTIGTVKASQMREVSYAVIEIPRINRTVLVCDQIGEATFVVYGIGDPRRFLAMTKEELLNHPSIQARRLIRRTPEQWHSDLGILLFTEQAWQEGRMPDQALRTHIPNERRPSLDVRKIVQVRDAILQSSYPTPQSWITMTSEQVRSFKLFEGRVGLGAIATTLGVEENPLGQKRARLEIAQKVFGEDPALN